MTEENSQINADQAAIDKIFEGDRQDVETDHHIDDKDTKIPTFEEQVIAQFAKNDHFFEAVAKKLIQLDDFLQYRLSEIDNTVKQIHGAIQERPKDGYDIHHPDGSAQSELYKRTTQKRDPHDLTDGERARLENKQAPRGWEQGESRSSGKPYERMPEHEDPELTERIEELMEESGKNGAAIDKYWYWLYNGYIYRRESTWNNNRRRKQQPQRGRY